jgi:RNA polymerase primary sigma factor
LQALAEQARIVRLPLNKIGSINKINQVFAKLEQDFERAPTPEEIAKELEIEAADIKQIINNTGHHVSMDAPISHDDDNNLYDIMLSKDSISPESDLLRESLNKEVERILSTLTNREAEIIRLYYGLNGRNALTLEEIGEKFDLTRERVRQIKGKVIKVLKSRSKILRSYL